MMTASQQVQAFLAHCAVIREGYVFSFKKNSSSLRYLIRALEDAAAADRAKAQMAHEEEAIVAALAQTSPKDHAKYKPAITSLFAVWGTTRDYVRLAANTAPDNEVLYWQPGDQPLTAAPAGIGIGSRYPGYHENVKTHLDALYHTAAGRTVLDALAGAAALKRTSIVDHTLSNQCGAQGLTNGMNSVARALFGENETLLRGPAADALGRAPAPALGTRNAWLAEQINATPRYQLKGVPAVNRCNLGVTEGQVAGWIGGTSIWTDYGNDRDCDQVKLGVILALYPYATVGTGVGSMVNYSLGNANPLNAERPPAIGLAHELIHAYYNLRGEQPGFEVENFSTVLFEYRCVGLGPWANAPISENAVRAQWNAALAHFDADDARNRKAVVGRAYYSPP
jgi:hypothetical protein